MKFYFIQVKIKIKQNFQAYEETNVGNVRDKIFLNMISLEILLAYKSNNLHCQNLR